MKRRMSAALAGITAVIAGCASHTAAPFATPGPQYGLTQSSTSAPSRTGEPMICVRRSLGARFAGGGMGTGNDFGSLVIWNLGRTRCRIVGAVTFTAYLSDGRRDANAHANRPVPPVDVVLPARMAPFRDGADPAPYLTADLMGPERDDPAQPDALCREQDKVAPAVLVLTVGSLTFRVRNSDPQSIQVKQIYGCHGRVLLEQVERAAAAR